MSEHDKLNVFRFPAALFTAALISGLVAIVSLGTGINEWGGFATVSAWAFCALSAAASRRFKSLTFTLWVLAFGASAWFFPWTIDVGEMTIGILKMILLPVLLGLLANRYAHRVMQKVMGVLPAVAMFSICVIIAITIALARADLVAVGLALFGAAACHNAAGYAWGYSAARGLGLDPRDSRTVALEVGIQNGGMATGLALNVLKSPAAALGSAVFGPWSAITSSVLASWWRRAAASDAKDGKS